MSTKRKSKSQRSGESSESEDGCGDSFTLSILHGELSSAIDVNAGYSPYDESLERDASSPGDGSTCSGPIYVRTPGFKNHAHAVTIKTLKDHTLKKGKKTQKKNTDGDSTDDEDAISIPNRRINGPRSKQTKATVPMRMRAFPSSFWEQPNESGLQAPGSLTTVLPPLFNQEGITDVSPVLTEKSKENARSRNDKEMKLNVGNTDLMIKLFDNVKDKAAVTCIKRNRPGKKTIGSSPHHRRDSDPCLGSVILPQISASISAPKGDTHRKSIIALMPMKHSSSRRPSEYRSSELCLPSLTGTVNYSKTLSDLVINL